MKKQKKRCFRKSRVACPTLGCGEEAQTKYRTSKWAPKEQEGKIGGKSAISKTKGKKIDTNCLDRAASARGGVHLSSDDEKIWGVEKRVKNERFFGWTKENEKKEGEISIKKPTCGIATRTKPNGEGRRN